MIQIYVHNVLECKNNVSLRFVFKDKYCDFNSNCVFYDYFSSVSHCLAQEKNNGIIKTFFSSSIFLSAPETSDNV